ncbi:MAG: hypothetical protein IT285_02080 [Bdellovibrionales bacterium]|nr:hypothetical protein [Bdellovibrionales bacterium]
MRTRVLRGALLGGLAAYSWVTISWLVLPFHGWTTTRFEHEPVVAALLRSQAPRPGLYLLPHPISAPNTESELAHRELRERGPSAFVVVNPGAPTDPASPWPYLASLVLHLAVAAGLSFAMAYVRPIGALRLGLGCAGVVTSGGFLLLGPLAWFFGFPLGYVALALADLALAWSLGGLMIARFAGPEGA